MTDDDAPQGADAPTEPLPTGLRVKDVLHRTAEELEELEAGLDPTTRAELESWFAGAAPTATPTAAPAPPTDEVTAELDARYEARQVRIAASCQAVEPWMVQFLERHESTPLPILRVVVPPPLHDFSILKIRVPSDDELATIAEPRQYEREDAVEDALREAVPQAILRDLARVEAEFTIEYVSPPADETAMIDAHGAVLEALAQRLVLPPVVSMPQIARDAHAEFAREISPPWADLVAAGKAWRAAR